LSDSSVPTPAARALLALLILYRATLSVALPPSCRFLPSCSAYAIDAIRAHGAVRGAWMALRRVARCHPWGGHGLDSVPAREKP
jgi:putative membrane protein insertion efficiency factor